MDTKCNNTLFGGYMGKWGTGKILRICKQCDKKFHSRHDRLGYFCSKSCAGKNKPKKYLRVIKICDVCLKDFEVKKYRENSALYCSNECRRKRMPSKENHVNWKGGIVRTWESKVLIKRLIKLRKECENCHSKKYLQGHHVIPYSKNKELQSCENNIQILCRLCHAKKHPEISNFILKGIIYE